MRNSLKSLEDFAYQNKWFQIYKGKKETGFLLPDGSTVIAYFDESRFLVGLVDAASDSVTIGSDAND